MAPPNTYANIAVNSSGCRVTSKNCSGLRRIFFSDRHAIDSVWATVSAMLVRGRARATAAAGSTVIALISTDLQKHFVVDLDVLRLLRQRGVVSGDGEEHLVERGLGHADRGDRDAGLPQSDQDIGRCVGGFEGDVDPPRPRRADRLYADDAANHLQSQLLIAAGRELQL